MENRERSTGSMASIGQFMPHLASGVALSVAVASTVGVLAFVWTPAFLDRLADVAIFCLVAPAVVGIAWAGAFYALQRALPGFNRIIVTFNIASVYFATCAYVLSVGFVTIILAVCVSPHPLVYVGTLVLTLTLWLFVLRRLRRRTPQFSIRRMTMAAALLFGACLVLFALRTPYRNFTVNSKVFIYGIDGASWTVMNPLMEKGLLRNFDLMRKQGSFGTLTSIDPMLSPALWTSIATGKLPDKHGIVSFYSTQQSLTSARLWDVFENHGMRVGVFRWLITWPPDEVNGFMIPDILARDARTYPQRYSAINAIRMTEKSRSNVTILHRLGQTWSLIRIGLRMSTIRRLGWALLENWCQGSDARSIYALKRGAELQINVDVFVSLLRSFKPDFVAFYDNGVDMVSHKYWEYFEPSKFDGVEEAGVRRYGRVIPAQYELVDRVFGQITGHFTDSTTVAVVSDHGFQAVDRIRHERYYPKMTEILALTQLDSLVYGIALAEKTFVRAKDAARPEALDTAQTTLEGITVDESGERLFRVKRDETSVIVTVKNPAVNLAYHVGLRSARVSLSEILYNHPPESGHHDIDGIILMRGPHILRGTSLTNAGILDIAPTILYLTDMPISDEMTGKILLSVITEDFRRTHEPNLVPDSFVRRTDRRQDVEFDKRLEKQLRSLGYVR